MEHPEVKSDKAQASDPYRLPMELVAQLRAQLDAQTKTPSPQK